MKFPQHTAHQRIFLQRLFGMERSIAHSKASSFYGRIAVENGGGCQNLLQKVQGYFGVNYGIKMLINNNLKNKLQKRVKYNVPLHKRWQTLKNSHGGSS